MVGTIRYISTYLPNYLPTYRMFGMDAIENFLYHLKCSQPTYQCIDMMTMIIIDAQYGSWNRLVSTLWRVESCTKEYHFQFISRLFQCIPALVRYSSTLGVCVRWVFYVNLTGRRTQIFPFPMVQITWGTKWGKLFLHDPKEFGLIPSERN